MTEIKKTKYAKIIPKYEVSITPSGEYEYVKASAVIQYQRNPAEHEDPRLVENWSGSKKITATGLDIETATRRLKDKIDQFVVIPSSD